MTDAGAAPGVGPSPEQADAAKTDAATRVKGRIGEKLLALGLITPDQLRIGLREKQRSSKMLGAILVELGFVGEAQLAQVLAEATGLERFDPKTTLADPDVVNLVPKEVALKYKVLPFSMTDRTAHVAMADAYDVLALDQVRRFLPQGVTIQPCVCPAADLSEAIDRAYGYEMSIEGILSELDTGQAAALPGEEEGYTHPVVRLVNALLLDAVKVGASDLHFEPEGQFLRLRYRVDGVMNEVRTFHRDYWPAISQRLKLVSGMNIADKLNPQDGRFSFVVGGHDIDFRVSVLPTVHGENIVLRVLDKSRALVDLDQIGFSPHNLKILRRVLKRPEGIILVTGPTGSGKTTTLYAMLAYINSIEVNIMTMEDPVEYQIPLIRQAQAKEGTGVNFDEGVRAILRQDPDVVLIGEIRDATTAQMALRAAMTGHQVFTTLHTNDAIGAVPRLLDLGLRPGMLAGSVIASLAQRLVRKLCTECRRARRAKPEECRILGLDESKPHAIHEAVGCPACRGTGYKGRTALVEILAVDEDLDEVIASSGSRAALKACARQKGFKSMAEDGADKVRSGEIDLNGLVKAVDLTARL